MNVSGFRIAIDTLAWFSEEAFQGDSSHSLLVNLKDLREEDWTATPPGRSITSARCFRERIADGMNRRL